MHALPLNLLAVLLLSHLSCLHVLVPVSAKVFLSIDCGSTSSEPYTDKRSIVWVGDNQYVKTGEARNVTVKDIPEGWDSRVMNTLREFPSGYRRCYSLDVNEDSSKVERVLVRASFYYGNYDNKYYPPTFDIHFNGNKWAYVRTSMSEIVYKEVVYSLKHGNTITVCLTQTVRDGSPFISALEVRSLDSDIYGYIDSNYPLIFTQREAYGTNTIVRYPEDSCDRIWDAIGVQLANISDDGVIRVKNTSPSIKVDIADKVPEALFTATLMRLNISRPPLRIRGHIDYPRLPMRFNAYFSEVIKLSSTQKRSFNITGYAVDRRLDRNSVSFKDYGPVIPPYGQALQVRYENITVDDYYSEYHIDLYATDDSNLPPLINALETYTIGDKLVRGTNSKDVSTLALLQKSFIQLQGWLGDPCLPSPYTWFWVGCDSNIDSPRVTALYLHDRGLVGNLPDFSDLDALESINLDNNSLSGKIPEFLGTFPKLKFLYLRDNNFSGAIPPSLLNKKNFALHVSGNPNLSTSSSNSKNSMRSTVPIIVFGSAIIQMLHYIFGL